MKLDICRHCRKPIDLHHDETIWPDDNPHHLECVLKFLIAIIQTLDEHIPPAHIPPQ